MPIAYGSTACNSAAAMRTAAGLTITTVVVGGIIVGSLRPDLPLVDHPPGHDVGPALAPDFTHAESGSGNPTITVTDGIVRTSTSTGPFATK